MKLVVSAVRTPRAGWTDEPCADWGRRIARHFPFEDRVVRPSTAEAEAEALFSTLGPRSRLIALDERGVDLTSPELAEVLERCAQDAVSVLVFALGGAYGHAPIVRERAWKTVRLSAMVMAHAVARVVLIEQVYRACAIRRGEPYHHV